MKQQLIVATHNQGKLLEFTQLMSDQAYEIVGAGAAGVRDVEESGLSFVENALIKARNACIQSSCPSLADDSGLEVDALEGAPGIYSSRYAGAQASDQQNVEKLLQKMQNVEHRSARFRCCLVVMRHAKDPAPLICEGSWEGHIATEPKGDNGFGYDPIFLPHDAIGSAAQLSSDQKHQLSHRAIALEKLKTRLARFLDHQ